MEPATPAARVTGSGRTLSLKGRALQLLARREHSREELLRKLDVPSAFFGAFTDADVFGGIVRMHTPTDRRGGWW